MTELKPCPFCGESVVVGKLQYEMGFGIIHPDNDCIWMDTDSPCSDNIYDTEEECIKKWNTRNEKHCSNCKYSYGLRCTINCGPICVCSDKDKWEKSRD